MKTENTWLSRNVAPLLALGTVSFAFSLLTLILMGNIAKDKENIAFAIIGFIGGTVTTVLSFYFGSSQSSSKKDEAIRNMASASNTGTTETTTTTTNTQNAPNAPATIPQQPDTNLPPNI